MSNKMETYLVYYLGQFVFEGMLWAQVYYLGQFVFERMLWLFHFDKLTRLQTSY